MGTPLQEFRNPFENGVVMVEQSQAVTPQQSRPRNSSVEDYTSPSPISGRAREKKRVGFTGDTTPARSPSLTPLADVVHVSSEPVHEDASVPTSPRALQSCRPSISSADAEQIRLAHATAMSRPRPALRSSRSQSQPMLDSAADSNVAAQIEIPFIDPALSRMSARQALQRGRALEEENVRTLSQPASPSASSDQSSVVNRRPSDLDLNQGRKSSSLDSSLRLEKRHESPYEDYTRHAFEPSRSRTATPLIEQLHEDYQPRPQRYHASILSALLHFQRRADQNDHVSTRRHREVNIPPGLATTPARLGRRTSKDELLGISPSPTPSLGPTPSTSGASTPRGWRSPWYFGSRNTSVERIGGSPRPGLDTVQGFGDEVNRRLAEHQERQQHPGIGDFVQDSATALWARRQQRKALKKEEHRIKRHISEVKQRHNYLCGLCKAMMRYGAPTHRLEDYLNMSARVLGIDAHFLYLNSAMIISFQDTATGTTEVQLVKEPSGLDLGRMRDVHEIYKEVVHDRISASQGRKRLHALEEADCTPRVNPFVEVLTYGVASAAVAPFAFQGQWLDLAPCFVLGCFVGSLKRWVSVINLYCDIWEILAVIITSFSARLLGSIGGGKYFCFSALAQSALALILPGYMVLMASLELQSRHYVAGSVRMVYAIIYSLMLGLGITIGTVLAGIVLPGAISETTCRAPISPSWYAPAVMVFTACLMVVFKAHLKQSPGMLVIAILGWLVNYNASQRIKNDNQVPSILGALAVGSLANAYSRFSPRVLDWYESTCNRLRQKIRRRRQLSTELEEGKLSGKESEPTRLPRLGQSLAAAIMLPAILVQVPSGISIRGSLISGLDAANNITSSMLDTNTQSATQTFNSTAFNIGVSVIQVALCITTGLFIAACMWYPTGIGRKRSGLSSF